MNKLAHIHQIVEVVKAITRIRPSMQRFTFFSRKVTWVYHAVFDEVFCPLCQEKAVSFVYSGDHLRREFPWMMIRDENYIRARVHMPRDDNCRCWLERVVVEPPKSEEERFEARLEDVKDSDASIQEAVREFERERRKRKATPTEGDV